MLVFGVDVPLIEVVFALAVIGFIVLIEIIIVVVLLMKSLRKVKEVGDLLTNLSQILLEVKKEEMKEIERLKR